MKKLGLILLFKHKNTIGFFQAILLALNYSVKFRVHIDLECRQFSLKLEKILDIQQL